MCLFASGLGGKGLGLWEMGGRPLPAMLGAVATLAKVVGPVGGSDIGHG